MNAQAVMTISPVAQATVTISGPGGADAVAFPPQPDSIFHTQQ